MNEFIIVSLFIVSVMLMCMWFSHVFPQNYPSSLDKQANSNISNGFSHSRPAFGKQQHKVNKKK